METHTEDLKRTPLYERHVALGGKLVGFAGWELPVRYTDVVEEHRAVRTAVGLFDVSHMGEVWIEGPEAERALDYLSCNALAKLYDGKALYSALLNEQGGVVDDIICYRFSEAKFLLCVNASNRQKDVAWLQSRNRFEAEIRDVSDDYGQVAVQGPKALELISSLCAGSELAGLKTFHFREVQLAGSNCIVARTGYTGEDGVEVFIPSADTGRVWDLLIDQGRGYGAVPVGLGARDSLRLEACYPLHGHELRDDVSALQSGLEWIVKFEKGEFIGRPALLAEKERGLNQQLVGFYVEDAGIVREGTELVDGAGSKIGAVTSGTKTPTLNRALGLARVASAYASIDSEFFAAVRGRKLRCKVVPRPFYRRTRS